MIAPPPPSGTYRLQFHAGFTFDDARRAQKTKYGGELFFADSRADPAGTTFLDFFQLDRSGQPKGIVALDLGGLP